MIGPFVMVLAFIMCQLTLLTAFKRWDRKMSLIRSREIESLQRRQSTETKSSGSIAVLSFGTGLRKRAWYLLMILVGVCFAMLVAVAIAVGVTEEQVSWDFILFLAVIFSISGASLWVIIFGVYGVNHIVTADGIVKHTAWTRSLSISLEQVKSVRWIPFFDSFLVRTDHNWFLVSPFLENLDCFAKGVMNNVPKEKWSGAMEKLEKASSGSF